MNLRATLTYCAAVFLILAVRTACLGATRSSLKLSQQLVSGLWLGIAAWMVVAVATAGPPVQPVERLDLQRWAGTWFEIARTPDKLQERCVGDATLTYSPVEIVPPSFML